jgi:hypothetical protein
MHTAVKHYRRRLFVHSSSSLRKHVNTVRFMSTTSHYQRLLTNHVLTQTNYLAALKRIDELVQKDDYGHELAQADINADNYTDLMSLFETMQCCILARSKMEDHNYLPIIQEDAFFGNLLDSEQRKKVTQSFPKLHVKEHIVLNHAKKLVNDLHKAVVRSNPKFRSETVEQFKNELGKVALAMHSLFRREQDEILSPVFEPQLGNEQKQSIHSAILEKIEFEELNLKNVEAVCTRLAEKTLYDILKFKEVSDRQANVADTILSEFRKSLPHHIWMKIAIEHDELSDDIL